MENVEVQVTQVLKQTKPEVPLGSPAKEVQPEAQLEPTAKKNIPAATVDMAALIATLQTMQHEMQLSPGVSGSQPFPQATEEERIEREKDAGDPIGSENELAQTNATAKHAAGLSTKLQHAADLSTELLCTQQTCLPISRSRRR
jgi:hypothetical protein